MKQVNDSSLSTLESCLQKCIQRGYFLHSNGEFNTWWLNLYLLNKKLEEYENLFQRTFQILLEEMGITSNKSFDTIAFTFSPDRQLVFLHHLIREITKDKSLQTISVRTIAPQLYKIDGMFGKRKHVLLISALSLHNEFIKKSIELIREEGGEIDGILILVHRGEHQADYRTSTDEKYKYSYLYRIFETGDRLNVKVNEKIRNKLKAFQN
jgi:hypothetical protein